MPSSQPISKVDNIQCRLVSWYCIGWNMCDILLLLVVTGALRRFTERLVWWFASRDCKAAIRSTGRFHDWKAQLFGEEITIKKLSIYLNSTPRYITKWGESLKPNLPYRIGCWVNHSSQSFQWAIPASKSNLVTSKENYNTENSSSLYQQRSLLVSNKLGCNRWTMRLMIKKIHLVICY